VWGWVAIVAVGVGALSLAAPRAVAKQKDTSRIVSGMVADQADNGIDSATVTLKDLQTGLTTAVYTHPGGQYQFLGLKPNHDYEVQADHKGLKSEARQVSSIDTRRRIVVNLTIPPPNP
jgi:hypothetical protein